MLIENSLKEKDYIETIKLKVKKLLSTFNKSELKETVEEKEPETIIEIQECSLKNLCEIANDLDKLKEIIIGD